MAEKYTAEIVPLNAEKIGTAPHGAATFTIDGAQMKIHIDMFDTPANVQHVPNDSYPVADAEGHYAYDKLVDLKELQTAFKAAFGSDDLQLDKRVIYIHGVPDTLKLPATVQGTVMNYDAHVTLPIAVGKISKA